MQTKIIIWPCTFQQEILVKFEERFLLIFQVKNNLIFVLYEQKSIWFWRKNMAKSVFCVEQEIPAVSKHLYWWF